MSWRWPLLLLTTCLVFAAAADDDPPWRVAGPGYRWAFPGDHHAMPDYRNEWWYLTGVLSAAGSSQPTHGFQLTIFRLGLMPDAPPWQSDWATRDLALGHLTVSDLAARRHVFSEVLVRAGPGRAGFPAAPDRVLAWVRAPAGTAGRWQLSRTDDGFAITAHDHRQGLGLDLALTAHDGPIFQGPDGYSVKDTTAGAGSLYYSYPRLQASGSVTVGGQTLATGGTVWLDREVFTSQLASRHLGWDWLGLRLDDGRSLMVFGLRDSTGYHDVTHATLVAEDGAVRWLKPGPDLLEPTDWWTSPESGARYPVAWTITIAGTDLNLDVSAAFAAQENVGWRSGIVYWEGMVVGQTDTGVAVEGYLEMTGYAGGRLPFR